MGKITLYSAMSLDGFLADPQGGIEWLDEIPMPEGEDFGYAEFYASIGITLMGRKTFDQVLGFDVPFPYKEKTNYVFTTHVDMEHEFVTLIDEDVATFVRHLKESSTENIWLVGGAKLNKTILEANLLDECIFHVMPVMLGSGISMFDDMSKDVRFMLTDHKTYENGVVELRYTV